MDEIEYTANPNPNDVNFLRNKLASKDSSCSPNGNIPKFGFFIRNEKDEMIAGAYGILTYQVITMAVLWVEKNHRKKGLATKLMDKVHALAKKKNCKMAILTTMDFENAENFYKKLGYKRDFKHNGYADGKYCIFMSKKL